MSLNYTSDLLTFFDTDIAGDPNYESPGNFGLTPDLSGTVPVDHVSVGTRGSYTTTPSATPSTGDAVFEVFMRLASISSVGAAGSGYAIGNVLKIIGGTRNTQATVTVTHVKVVSAVIQTAGTGYDDGATPSTFNATVSGGSGTSAIINVTTDGAGHVLTVNSITNAGDYTATPANPVSTTGDDGTHHGSNLKFTLVYGVQTVTAGTVGVYRTLPTNPAATSTTGGGTGATLNLAWGVDSINVVEGGSYEAGMPPTMVFSSGAATATAVLAAAASTSIDTQKLLVLVEIIRSLVAETSSPTELKDIHEVLRKMMGAMKFGYKQTWSTSANAAKVVAAAMNYIAKNPTHGNASL